jgi:hypothetical protein
MAYNLPLKNDRAEKADVDSNSYLHKRNDTNNDPAKIVESRMRIEKQLKVAKNINFEYRKMQ